jgi:hypothetical protein
MARHSSDQQDRSHYDRQQREGRTSELEHAMRTGCTVGETAFTQPALKVG